MYEFFVVVLFGGVFVGMGFGIVFWGKVFIGGMDVVV